MSDFLTGADQAVLEDVLHGGLQILLESDHFQRHPNHLVHFLRHLLGPCVHLQGNFPAFYFVVRDDVHTRIELVHHVRRDLGISHHIVEELRLRYLLDGLLKALFVDREELEHFPEELFVAELFPYALFILYFKEPRSLSQLLANLLLQIIQLHRDLPHFGLILVVESDFAVGHFQLPLEVFQFPFQVLPLFVELLD